MTWRVSKAGFWNTLRTLPTSRRFGPSKGTFSALELLRDGKLEGRLLEPPRPNPERGPKPLRRLMGMQGEHGSWPVFWTRTSNARLVGKTLVLQDERKRICHEAAFGPFLYRRDPAFNYLYLPAPVRLEGNWTSVISQWSQGFYEWFFAALPRLRLLPQFPPDTRVLVPHPLASYQKDTLAWLGLEGRYRATSEIHLVIGDFYFSSPAAMPGCYDPYAAQFLRDSFLTRADRSYDSPRRFYVQRRGQSRGIVNEAEVIALFRERDWGIVDTEQLTMAQQIQLFANAEAVCTLHGAALTNLVWCRPGTPVLEIVADTFVNGVYEGLAAMVGVEHQFLLCPGDHLFRAVVDMRQLREQVDLLELQAGRHTGQSAQAR